MAERCRNSASRRHRPAADHPMPEAFTLVDLLVAAAIAALVVGLLLRAIGAGRDAVSQSDLRRCGVIQETYAAGSSRLLVNPFGSSAEFQKLSKVGHFFWRSGS